MPERIHSDAYFLPGGRRGALLIHGLTASPTETRPLGEFLHSRGMTVLGVRLAGHGTRPEDLERTTWQDWYRSVREGFFQLQKSGDRLFVGGVSLGGILGAIFAADNPGAVSGLTLLTPPFFPRSKFLFLAPVIALFRKELPKGKESQAYYDRHGLFSYSVRPTRSLVEFRKAVEVGYRRLPEVKAPAQVIMGGKDRLVDPASGRRILARLGSLEKDFFLAENSDHIITVEPDASEVFERVWDFFEKC